MHIMANERISLDLVVTARKCDATRDPVANAYNYKKSKYDEWEEMYGQLIHPIAMSVYGSCHQKSIASLDEIARHHAARNVTKTFIALAQDAIIRHWYANISNSARITAAVATATSEPQAHHSNPATTDTDATEE